MATDHPRFPYDAHSSCHLADHVDAINLVFDWSHKDSPPGRFFGLFKCDVCSKEWGSVWTWLGRGQKCRQCTRTSGVAWETVEYTKPYEVQPRLTKEELKEKYRKEGKVWNENHRPTKSPHYHENCEYCAELCGSIHRRPGRHACDAITPGDPYVRAYRP